VQAAKEPASSLQAKVLPASVAVKLKLALVLLVVADGLAVIVVSGAVASIVQVKLAGVASTLPAGSMARTWKVWLPSVKAL
jgi:adenine deaminase